MYSECKQVKVIERYDDYTRLGCVSDGDWVNVYINERDDYFCWKFLDVSYDYLEDLKDREVEIYYRQNGKPTVFPFDCPANIKNPELKQSFVDYSQLFQMFEENLVCSASGDMDYQFIFQDHISKEPKGILFIEEKSGNWVFSQNQFYILEQNLKVWSEQYLAGAMIINHPIGETTSIYDTDLLAFCMQPSCGFEDHANEDGWKRVMFRNENNKHINTKYNWFRTTDRWNGGECVEWFEDLVVNYWRD